MPTSPAWSHPPEEFSLPIDEVHVWRASLDCDSKVLKRLEELLSPDEKSRAARFIFDRDRYYFVAARGILRDLLGAYLKRPPAELEFRYGPQGKPALCNTDSVSPLHFNLSHSQGLALYAFSRGREVGVDLELIRPEFATEEIANRYFSTQEVKELQALPQDLQPEGFFLCWTRKEAYVKARGEGLQVSLGSFNVSLTPGQPAELHSVDCSRWTLRSFRLAERYAAAVVGGGKEWRLQHWEWKP
jgi:4'-phosphopantetheinyl transferase